MKTLRLPLVSVLLLLLAAGCNTLDSRISKNQGDFDSWPADVREKIRAGRVDIGFTPDQVLVALGEPQKKYTRTTERGSSEVWAYTGSRTSFSIGIGMGSSSGLGGGVAYSPTTYGADDEKVRVLFEGGRVTSVEARAK